jgi:serine/threonine-protein kinase
MKVCTDCDLTFEDSIRFCEKCGAVLSDDAGALVGTTLDNLYRIEALLGQGGMGAVYKARHILLGDKVAIKVIKPEVANNKEFLRRFQREGQAARRFKHPNAVTVHDLRATADGLVYMVLEFIEGRNLREEMRAHGLYSPAETIDLLAPVASLLDAAHAQGVVHRDLKPENIMVTKDVTGARQLKVLDLGIAKLQDTEDTPTVMTGSALTVPGQALGTPPYMSPEQWGELPRDGNSEIDGRADVYSFGVIVYELVSGVWPITGASVNELRRGHISSKPRRLDERNPAVPAAFGSAVARALAKDRSDRFATAGEFLTSMRRSLDEGVCEGDVDVALPPREPGATERQRALGTRLATDPGAVPTISDGSTAPPASSHFEPESLGRFRAAFDSEAVTIVDSVANASEPAVVSKAVPAQRRNSVWLTAVVLVVLAGAVLFAMRGWRGESVPPTPSVEQPAVTAPAALPPAVSAPVLSYLLTVSDASGHERRVSGLEPFSGDRVRFNFAVSAPGFLYLVVPDERNVPTLVMSSHVNGSESASAAVAFPPTGFLGIADDTHANDVTVVFSPYELEGLALLRNRTPRTLSTAEQGALETLRTTFDVTPQPAAPSDSAAPAVQVRPGRAGDPAIFTIRLVRAGH